MSDEHAGAAEVRSKIMRAVRRRDTKAEMKLRRGLHAAGLRYRVDVGDLPGTPDLALRRFRAVIFVHGCFWHRHVGCRRATTPKSNTGFWDAKFRANVARDRRAVEQLRAADWRVATVWECALLQRPVETVADVVRFLRDPTRAEAEWPQPFVSGSSCATADVPSRRTYADVRSRL